MLSFAFSILRTSNSLLFLAASMIFFCLCFSTSLVKGRSYLGSVLGSPTIPVGSNFTFSISVLATICRELLYISEERFSLLESLRNLVFFLGLINFAKYCEIKLAAGFTATYPGTVN